MTQPAVVLDLGFAPDYEEVWRLQKDLVARRARREIPDTLILVEHDHVYTTGRKGKGAPPSFREAPAYAIERGGDLTYHGPGQLVGYPVVRLREWPQDVKEHLRRLERLLATTVAAFGIGPAEPGPHTGLWIGGKKLASIGVAVRRMVTYHGFALNVHPDLEYFRAVRPCGVDGALITSMEELGHPATVETVKRPLLRAYEAEFVTYLDPEEARPPGAVT